METTITKERTTLTIAVKGRLDSSNAGILEQTIKDNMDGMDSVVFLLKELEYTSSAGLRVLLATAKLTGKLGGSMKIIGVTPEVREVLDITGMLGILDVE